MSHRVGLASLCHTLSHTGSVTQDHWYLVWHVLQGSESCVTLGIRRNC